MTYTTYTESNKTNPTPTKTWGGYQKLASYQTTEIIYDLTVEFCRKFVGYTTHTTYKSYKTYSRTQDQMVQAARSGKQNIAEGSVASQTSKKTEIKLMGVARASITELLEDFKDFLRQEGLKLWEKDDPRVLEIRKLAYKTDKSYTTYKTYTESKESAANCGVCLCNQACYLLDKQIRVLEEQFLKEGGYTENLFKKRVGVRRNRVGIDN